MEEADQNTKYFHQTASPRRRKNNFRRLCTDNNDWVAWGDGLEELIEEYYSTIFKSQNPKFHEIIQLIQPKIIELHSQMLCEPFIEEEVKSVIFSMHYNKALGPYSFNPGFYQSF